MSVYQNLQANGLTIPPYPQRGGVYVKVKRTGNHLYVSGQGPIRDGVAAYTGKLGGAVTLEEGRAAARICALNLLSCVEEYTGDLEQVKNVVKLLAFVACENGFYQQPQVVNAASEIFFQVFGDTVGGHARSAIGTNALPGNIPVEIEAIFEIEGGLS